MNDNIIDNIYNSGAIEGWVLADNLDHLSNTLHFDSFEQANYFIQEVGKFCELNDHHPEWKSLNGGKSLEIKLTSHFKNNKVSPLDF